MPATLPTIRVRRGYGIGNQIFVKLPDLSDQPRTFLSADEASSQTTLSVVDGGTFSGVNFIVLRGVGNQQAEIAQVSSATASTIVVSSGTTYAHPRGTEIVAIPFNQIEITTDDNSAFSSATTLSTEALDVEQAEHFYEHSTGASTDYYRVRFVDSVNTRYSQYSDVVLATGFGHNTVFECKRRALDGVGHKLGDFEWLTDSWLNRVIEQGRRLVESQRERWSFRKFFDSDIGNAVLGARSISAPSDLRASETAKNLLSVRIGKNGSPLTKIDKKEMNRRYLNVAHTTLSSAASAGASTLSLTSSRDFDLSGSVRIGGAPQSATITGTVTTSGTTVTGSGTSFTTQMHAGDVLIDASSNRRRITAVSSATAATIAAAFTVELSGATVSVEHRLEDEVNYDDNDITNGVLRGLDTTGDGAVQHAGWASGADVWQDITFGMPEAFTVTEDGLVFDRPFGQEWHDQNIFADYWGTFTSVDSDADTFDEPDYDMFDSYLMFRIKKRKAKGQLQMENDDDGKDFLRRMAALIAREVYEEDIHFVPDIAHLDSD